METETNEKHLKYYSGLLIKKARKEIHMTQGELAAKLGTDTAYISRIENNTIIPSVGQFYRIAEILGYTIKLIPYIQQPEH